jgi:16S rRNA (uracil1498-N3)-methyltransferase
MLDRFYAPESLQQTTITLTGAEAQHLSRVLRKQLGDEVNLFDGKGCEAQARIDALDRRTVTLFVVGPVVERPTTGLRVVLATAVPKGDRARWLVEKATELGAAGWIPLLTERSVVDPRNAKLEKLQQTVIAACKQCGRNDLMPIHRPRQWSEFLAEDCRGATLLVADPAGPPLRESLIWESVAQKESITVAIGPEGGFTDAEEAAARAAGARPCGLGEFVLRIETDAVATLAAIRMGIVRH